MFIITKRYEDGEFEVLDTSDGISEKCEISYIKKAAESTDINHKVISLLDTMPEELKEIGIEQLGLRTAPSSVAEAFDYDCERHFVYSSMNKSLQKVLGVEDKNRQTHLSKAGEDFENEILTDKKYGVYDKYKPLKSETDDKFLSYEETIEFLKNPFEGYLYQTTLRVNTTFKEKYEFNSKFSFKDTHPDLIKIDFDEKSGKYVFSIIDIKLARKMKMKQKVQVTLYALILQAIFEENNINGIVNLEEGYIWNNGKDKPEPFKMQEIIPFIDKFLLDKVKSIYEKLKKVHTIDSLENTFNHKKSYHCEWCNCYNYCFNRSCERKDIKTMPYLSKYAQSYIDDINKEEVLNKNNENSHDISIEDLSTYIQSKGVEKLNLCKSWKDHTGKYDDKSLIIDKELELLELYQKLNIKKVIYDLNNVNYNDTDRRLAGDIIEKNINVLREIKITDKEVLEEKLNAIADKKDEWFRKRTIYKLKEVKKILALIDDIQKYMKDTDYEKVKESIKNLLDCNLNIQKIYIKDRALMSMPIYEDVKIILTAQADEATGRMFVLGFKYCMNSKNKSIDDLGITEKQTDHVFAAKTKNDFDNIENEFVDELYGFLEHIDSYNKQVYDEEAVQKNDTEKWKKQFSVQSYVMDNYEWENLKTVLFNMIKEGRKVPEVLKILFYLQGGQLVTDCNSHPDEITSAFPVIAITQAVRQLFIIPGEISYGIDDISAVFEEKPFKKFIPRYSNIITNVFPSEIINRSWELREAEEEKAEEYYNKVLKHTILRLSHENGIINGIRDEISIQEKITNKKILTAWGEKFRFKEEAQLDRPILSKMYFETKYEEILKYIEIREQRMKSIEGSIEEGKVLDVTYTDKSEPDDEGKIAYYFDVNNPVMPALLSLDGNIILCRQSEECLNKIREFNDFNKVYINEEGIVRILFPEAKFSEQPNDRVKLIITQKKNEKINLIKHESYYIFKQYIDWNSAKITGGKPSPLVRKGTEPIKGILKEIEDNKKKFIDLLEDPCNRYFEQYDQAEECDTLDNLFEYKFTESQEEAFNKFLKSNISLVLGPPGTGKTDFIAKSLIILSEYNKHKNRKPLKILISGMSHAAIENVLITLNKHIKEIKNEDISLLKLKTLNSNNEAVKIVQENDIGKRCFENRNLNENIIIGATLWGTGKAYVKGNLNEGQKFDIVVIDEASQVRSMDALLAITAVSNKGKLLIVGDDNQLPPIIQGNYITDEESVDDIDCYKSIFSMLYQYDKIYKNKHGEYRYTTQLNEQFRMNNILSMYSSQKIYGEKYKAGTNVIASHKIPIIKNSIDEVFEDYVMDPEYPFVVCTLSGGNSIRQREQEVEKVSRLVEWSRKYLCKSDKNKRIYESEEEFWHSGMFIVSPHHEQIGLIRKKLSDITIGEITLAEKSFVDTVDKMQGQQSDVCIVSYGVADLEKAILEKEFIFNMNRLNVSITRAKKKTILFLSEVLINKNLDFLDETDEELLKGIEFVNSIETFAKTQDKGTECVEKKFMYGDVCITVYKKRCID